ncbi:hypothetical protein L6452_37482 [Arctium lappa]|uniref:Uncharacterized protein n=1 Tax=Arctium lappa TaxID=4217 RepID=A0ACB8Y340_ARCLA|nr:hypothetical protein L6452_37482 [Arctium lappa]
MGMGWVEWLSNPTGIKGGERASGMELWGSRGVIKVDPLLSGKLLPLCCLTAAAGSLSVSSLLLSAAVFLLLPCS